MLETISPSLAKHLASQNPTPPPRLGIRYDAQGRFLQEPGNTIICHLERRSPSESAILAVRERMMAMPGADTLAFTPASSLHMTLFPGVIDSRRALPYWPADIPLTARIEDMMRRFLTRLDGFEGNGAFDVRITAVKPTGLTVEGATEADRETLRGWRDALAHTLGYRHPDHDTYVFHITFAYPIRGLPDARAGEWQAFLDQSLAFLQREAPLVALRNPAFCAFRTMERFEELLILE